jgi:hypothetical protein
MEFVFDICILKICAMFQTLVGISERERERDILVLPVDATVVGKHMEHFLEVISHFDK